MLAIVWSLERFHQYTFGKHIVVQSDHKPLESLMCKPLSKAPRRLQGMMMRLMKYDTEIIYTKGTNIFIADMLSRAYVNYPSTEQSDLEHINAVQHLPIRQERLKQIQLETERDDNLQALKQIIMHGWPDQKSDVPPNLIPYYGMRDELTTQNGLVFKGEQIVIPIGLRADMKKAVHSSHIGIEGCLRRARECLFWPGMSSELKQYISTCETCRMFEIAPAKETLMSHDVPDRPWQKVGIDLLTHKSIDYVITVDYFSNFWEIDKLNRTTSNAVIKKSKHTFQDTAYKLRL